MGWCSSNRRERLPGDWKRRRRFVLLRDDYVCQLALAGCKGSATEVDHAVRGDDHSLGNLRAVCSECHKKKTSAEAQEARRDKAARRFRPVDRHPGVL